MRARRSGEAAGRRNLPVLRAGVAPKAVLRRRMKRAYCPSPQQNLLHGAEPIDGTDECGREGHERPCRSLSLPIWSFLLNVCRP